MPGRMRTVEFMASVSCRITFAITGGVKRCDKGAPLYTVRVDGIVIFHEVAISLALLL